MLNEVLNFWLPHQQQQQHGNAHQTNPDRPIHLVDGTIGLGGHTLAALLARNNVCMLGIDRDESALTKAKKHILSSEFVESSSSRVSFHHASFLDISNLLSSISSSSTSSKTDGILMDLGMNSTQIHNHQRGFTFRKHGALDMRFDNTTPSSSNRSIKARDIVNAYPASELSNIFSFYADEPYAIEIAADIVQWRKSLIRGESIQSTLELRYIIEEAVEKCIARDASSTKKENKQPTKKDQGGKKKKSFDQYRMIWHPPKWSLTRKKKEKYYINMKNDEYDIQIM